jgi:outer membrane lipoprotein-sorting protein
MKAGCRLFALAGLSVSVFLTGCSLFPTTRKLPVPRAPAITQSIAPEELVDRLDQRSAAIHTLFAKVEIHATKTKESVATDYPSVDGIILMRKPSDLRVVGTYAFVRVFDMASIGDCFTMSIPHYDKVLKGCGTSKHKSDNTLENLRPGFFFDAILVRGLDPDDRYSVTSETFMVEDAAKKHLYSVPEYVLRITRYKAGTQEEAPVRVVYFHRDDLMPYQQDIYDNDGNLETQVTYQGYQDFEGNKYPSVVTIKRPIEDIQIVLNVENVKENQTLGDEQFVVQIPTSSKIVNVE